MTRLECEQTIPAPWGGDQEVECGTPYTLRKNYCNPCMAYYTERYPQGWSYYAGDICDHGMYTGGIGYDYMCGYCDEVLTSKTHCIEYGCEYFEWTRETNQWRTIHVPNPVRDTVAKMIMSQRGLIFDIQNKTSSTGNSSLIHNPAIRDEWHRLIRDNSSRYVHGVEETN